MFSILGYIAATLTTLSFLPQAIKTIKERDTKGISLTMYITFTAGVFLWVIYGVYIQDKAILIGNAVTLLFAVVILNVKIKNVKSEG